MSRICLNYLCHHYRILEPAHLKGEKSTTFLKSFPRNNLYFYEHICKVIDQCGRRTSIFLQMMLQKFDTMLFGGYFLYFF